MDFMTKTLLLIVSLSSLFLLSDAYRRSRIHAVHRDVISSDLLKFCEVTTNPNLCAQTIQPHFLDGVNLDPFKALEIEVEATLNETRRTLSIIEELLEKNNLNKSLRDSVKTCKDQYHSILDSIRETKEAIAQRNLIEAKFKFSAVISYQSTCKDQFENANNKCPFAEDNEIIFQLGGIALDIIATLARQEPAPPVPTTTSSQSSQSISVIGTIS
ncbi:hypothetical protein RIF29_40976 [Crotalaria pallida]|uniref:Pectinesterase inhibitor domain-containing protein n=1 Tax=Crotalaria pallida TaxID=3830 RepID=A0AAN9E6G9_CROPI